MTTFFAGSKATAADLNDALDIGTWASWTPTITGWTLGNGAFVASYIQLNKLVHFRLRFTLGSTTVTSGTAIQFSPPATPVAGVRQYGVAMFLDSSASNARYAGWTEISTAVNIAPLALTASDGSAAGVINNRPFTWAQNDIVYLSGTYEAA